MIDIGQVVRVESVSFATHTANHIPLSVKSSVSIPKWQHMLSRYDIFIVISVLPYVVPPCPLSDSTDKLFWTSKASICSKIDESDNACWLKNQQTKGTNGGRQIKETEWVAEMPSSILPAFAPHKCSLEAWWSHDIVFVYLYV